MSTTNWFCVAFVACFAGACGGHSGQPTTTQEGAGPGGTSTPPQIYGVWHCGDDACTWSSMRDIADFDQKNHWLIDRGDGMPSVNLVILSFVNPLKLLNRTSDAETQNGVPIGMTADIVRYFESRGVRVMLSIGGITYTNDWDAALAADGAQLGLNAAAVASELGVGIEIDYENSSNPNLAALQAFVDAYRSRLSYDPSGANHAARLTIDLAAGTRWLVELTAKASRDWLDTEHPVLDYANAMVSGRNQPDASVSQTQWLEHVDGDPRMTPPIVPLAPAKFTGSLWLHGDSIECAIYSGSVTEELAPFVQTVAPAPGVGTSPGLLGFMFWAAECEGTKTTCTTPPNSCEGGVGQGGKALNVPFAMPPLRQR